MKQAVVIWFFMLSLATLAGCSSKELYKTGQAWQENQCFRIDDIQERNRCLSNASVSHEQYKQQVRELEAASQPK